MNILALKALGATATIAIAAAIVPAFKDWQDKRRVKALLKQTDKFLAAGK